MNVKISRYRLYVSRKDEEKGLASIEDSVGALI